MARSSLLNDFTCSRFILIAINAVYIVVAFILIGLAAYAKAVAYIVEYSVMGGIIACGVFLLIIACVGVIGSTLHHQATLFFYMIILFLLFIVQFIVACACLSIGPNRQKEMFEVAWWDTPGLQEPMQSKFDCCACITEKQRVENSTDYVAHPPCNTSDCCKNNNASCCTGVYDPNEVKVNGTCPCKSCWDKVSQYADKAIKAAGGVGLFFSFTEVLGVWLAYRFRNLKDPGADPNQFL